MGELVAESGEIEVAKDAFAAADEDWRGDEVHLVDEAGAKILLDGGGASAEANIFAVGGGDGLLERAMNAVGDEVEGGASFHGERRAGVMGEDEDGHVVGRIVAPPTFP